MPLMGFGQRVPFHPGPCTRIRGQRPPHLEARSADQVHSSWLLTQGLGNLGVQQGRHRGGVTAGVTKRQRYGGAYGGTGYVANWRAFLCPSFPELSFEDFSPD